MHAHESAAYCPRPGKMGYRYLLGVKWSQVQILSARQAEIGSELRLSVFVGLIMRLDGRLWDRGLGVLGTSSVSNGRWAEFDRWSIGPSLVR